MATRFAAAKAAQASSTALRCDQAITRMANRLDWCVGAELLTEATDANFDHIRARIEAVTPHLSEQPLPAQHLALVKDEVMEETELAVREIGHERADLRLAAREIQHQRPRRDDVGVTVPVRLAQLRFDPRNQ